ncbi:MAG: hypothetical protein L0227_17605 [Chloroflexi bacterium]|nr:hypothetical protein [Chloroflexota bacterium]
MHPAVIYAVASQHLQDRQREAHEARLTRAETLSSRPARRRWRAIALTLHLPGFVRGASEPAS